ncbi:MAG: pyrroline-5-carboxylate reductase [Ruminococcaceae bacterium]|nr:pyrroline-5-carboxylate reductase [Oscillospiraceae bacterium]
MMKKIGFIGAGNMGGALAAAVARTDNTVFVCCAHKEKAEALAADIGAKAATVTEIVDDCDVIFLGVKPQILPQLAENIKDQLAKRAGQICLVSMAAGVTCARLAELFGEHRIIRIMPNTPVSIGEGVILYCLGDNSTTEDEKTLCDALSMAGCLHKMQEKLIDAATAVSGCGPAFVYMFIEALADGGVKCGIPREKAQLLAAQTLAGAAQLCIESGKHPGELKDAVCSPGGSTIAGVAALERGKFRAAVIDAVESAYKRTKEL